MAGIYHVSSSTATRMVSSQQPQCKKSSHIELSLRGVSFLSFWGAASFSRLICRHYGVGYMYFFFLNELTKFTISDFPISTLIILFFFLQPLIDPHSTKMIFAGCTSLAEKQCQSVDRLVGEEKKSDQYVPKICLLRKITYGEFSEFVREKKITYIVLTTFLQCTKLYFECIFFPPQGFCRTV